MAYNLLDRARSALRITSKSFDDEIQTLLTAAFLDMQASGVDVSADNELIKTAALTYVKANFGFDNPDSARLQAAYENQLQKLSLAYNEGGDV